VGTTCGASCSLRQAITDAGKANGQTHSIVMSPSLATNAIILLSVTPLALNAASNTNTITINGTLSDGSRVRITTASSVGVTSTVDPGAGSTYELVNIDTTNLGFTVNSGTLSLTNVSLLSDRPASTGLVAFNLPNADTGLQLTNCAVKDYKRSVGDGAAISAVAATTVSVTASRIEGCSAVNGGAIAANSTTLTLQRAWLANNTATGFGGAVYAGTGTLSASRCLWRGNTAAFGGAIYATGMAGTTIKSSAIVGNTATTSGGGIFAADAKLGMHSVTLLDNAAPTAPAISNTQTGPTPGSIANSVLWGSAATVFNAAVSNLQLTHTLWKGGSNSTCGGTTFCSLNTLSTDPKLSPVAVSQADAGPATFWEPAADGAAYNTGSNSTFGGVTGESVDMRGNARLLSCAVDRGAIESTQTRPPTAAPPAPYNVNEDTTLTVAAAQGLLVNASYPDACNSLTVVLPLASLPANGTVTVQANGSFVYVPSSNFNGVDTFTYNVRGGNTTIGPLTARINVGALLLVFFLSCWAGTALKCGKTEYSIATAVHANLKTSTHQHQIDSLFPTQHPQPLKLQQQPPWTTRPRCRL
jgi:predicted outer membrane repeat protein